MALSMPKFIQSLLRPFMAGTSASLFPAGSIVTPEGSQKATLAAGCFWGVEHVFRKEFSSKGLYDARVGYIGGNSPSPSYRQVCSGQTGYAEAVQLTFDPNKVSYQQLLEFFYRMHDPTTPNRQGPDTGTQYRSAIFYHDENQESIAREITKKVNQQWYKGRVTTEILPAGQWWDAEDYHQRYLEVNPGGYECPSHFVRNFSPLD